MARYFNEDKTVFLTYDAGAAGCPHENHLNHDLYPTPHTKVNLQRVIDLNVKVTTIKLLDDHMCCLGILRKASRVKYRNKSL